LSKIEKLKKTSLRTTDWLCLLLIIPASTFWSKLTFSFFAMGVSDRQVNKRRKQQLYADPHGRWGFSSQANDCRQNRWM